MDVRLRLVYESMEGGYWLYPGDLIFPDLGLAAPLDFRSAHLYESRYCSHSAFPTYITFKL